jgi:hypothetical protein
VASNSRPYRRLISAETCPSSAISACSEQPALKLVESNIPTLSNTSAGAGAGMLFTRLVITGAG